MNPDLQRLIQLQQLETAADAARRRIAEQPERSQALEARLRDAEAALENARARLAENQGARRVLEKDQAAIQGRLSKFKGQLMEVKTNREYQTMQKEIEVAAEEVQRIEDQILDRMLEADGLGAAVKAAEQALAAEKAAVAADRRALDEEVAALQKELEETSAAREPLVAALDARLLYTFEQIARMRKGVAVAEARDGHCTICHVRLRPQVFNEVRRNDSIIQCDTCQRILYFVAAPSSVMADEAVQ